jgi:regulator of protease activity HflC (stomatin/prohibitin superfamily)
VDFSIRSIVIIAVCFMALIFGILTFRFITVDPTEVAVEVNKAAGKINQEPRGVGYHFFNGWITDMVKYRVAARSYPSSTRNSEGAKDYTMTLKTNDGQNVEVDLTVIYSLNAKDVPALHQQIGPSFEDQVILPQIRSEARIAIGNYTAEELYTGKVRDVVQTQIKERLVRVLAKYPAINIQDALIRHFNFSRQFEGAIEAKKLAAQEIEINRNKALAQEEKAKQEEAQARGFKLKVVQEAEGRAQSAKIEADAQRYKLEQEASGNLAIYKADAEGKRLSADALGGGQNVVALEFAKNIPDKLQIWGIPTGSNSTSLMDLNGLFGNMLKKRD